MSDGQITARTMREAFSAGKTLVRSRFWQYVWVVFALTGLALAGGVLQNFAIKHRLWTFEVVFAFLWSAIFGILNLGLYRSFWESMCGQPVRAQILSWGFRKSSRWALPVIWAILSIPFVLLHAQSPQPIAHPPSLGAISVFVLEGLAGIVVSYAYALIARFDAAPADALRMAMRIFQKGKRRWFALPFVAGLVLGGATVLVILAVMLIVALGKALALAKGVMVLILIVILVPVGLGSLFALFPWMGGALLAASGDLTDNGSPQGLSISGQGPASMSSARLFLRDPGGSPRWSLPWNLDTLGPSFVLIAAVWIVGRLLYPDGIDFTQGALFMLIFIVVMIAATGYAGWLVVRRGGGTPRQAVLAGPLFPVIFGVLSKVGWWIDARALDEAPPHPLPALHEDWAMVAGVLVFWAGVAFSGGLIARSMMRRQGEGDAPMAGKQGGPWKDLASGVFRNLRNGARVAFFANVEPGSWVISVGQLIALILWYLAVVVILDRTYYRGDLTFYWRAFRAHSTGVLISLLSGWLTARLAARRVHALLVPVALAAAAFPMYLIMFAIYHAALHYHWSLTRSTWHEIYLGLGAWYLLAVVMFVRRSAGMRLERVGAAVLPVIALTIYNYRFPPYAFWYGKPAANPAVASARSGDSPVAEKFLYLEPRLARQAIGSLRPHEGKRANFYFVGFAPDADQNVFMNEVEAIRKLMDARFGTQGRSLLLINNRNTLGHYPLATVTNLRLALRHIGSVMDRRKDVLVIYLTSHGSPSFHLVSDFWPLQLNEINPILLRHLLHESGIKWRVVIVSACYSGGFIAPLRGPTTLVMTAADATHTSFGCSDHGKYTYFGRALFDDELRRTYSFSQAFEQALPIIRAREKRLGDVHSNPQIAEGDAIRLKLARIDQRLNTTPRPAERIAAQLSSTQPVRAGRSR